MFKRLQSFWEVFPSRAYLLEKTVTLKSILRLAADIRIANGPPEYFELDDVWSHFVLIGETHQRNVRPSSAASESFVSVNTVMISLRLFACVFFLGEGSDNTFRLINALKMLVGGKLLWIWLRQVRGSIEMKVPRTQSSSFEREFF